MSRDTPNHEMRLVGAFFGDIKGYFVEVGANEPRERSQTWFLEQAGWTGVLVEPQPDLAVELRTKRKARVFEVACSSPENAGRNLSFHVAGPLSSLDRHHMAPGAMPERVISVPVRTLDSILTEADTPVAFDFLSTDVEGHEIEMLRGFDVALEAALDPAGGSCRQPVEAPVTSCGRLSNHPAL